MLPNFHFVSLYSLSERTMIQMFSKNFLAKRLESTHNTNSMLYFLSNPSFMPFTINVINEIRS